MAPKKMLGYQQTDDNEEEAEPETPTGEEAEQESDVEVQNLIEALAGETFFQEIASSSSETLDGARTLITQKMEEFTSMKEKIDVEVKKRTKEAKDETSKLRNLEKKEANRRATAMKKEGRVHVMVRLPSGKILKLTINKDATNGRLRRKIVRLSKEFKIGSKKTDRKISEIVIIGADGKPMNARPFIYNNKTLMSNPYIIIMWQSNYDANSFVFPPITEFDEEVLVINQENDEDDEDDESDED
ncbi:unnamed protein product [Effrenium voratum]|uniref:Uncharacterized protein n=1 Tax=Effrenium voratum TaxID=2562239 RepID=A0AA36HYI2_9DINO|nr:unnamed protein product [Effrenium voratum]CAJ1428640.1 unnamed protein product [Effrenium voratum]CAJ1429837.1 unnamed protein product [Effrenium voratum]